MALGVRGLALLGMLAVPASVGELIAEETPGAVVQEVECRESLEVCVKQKREEWKARGVLGMKIHAPHVEGADEHPAGEEHMAGVWYVELVAPAGAAKTTGIRSGDQLLEWDTRPMPPGREIFNSWTEAVRAGDKITVKMSRDGEIKVVTLTASPAEAWVVDAWLIDYVKQNYSEGEYLAYREKVMARVRQH